VAGVVVEVAEVRISELPGTGVLVIASVRKGAGGIDRLWMVVCGRVATCGAPPAGWWLTVARPGSERGREVGEVREGWGCAGGGWMEDGEAR
jgi:hypothetical protein